MAQRERSYTTEAIILRRRDLGEADRLLTVLTPQRGKLRLVAKGARKPRSRKAGHVELFMRSNLLVARGRGELDLITQAQVRAAYLPVRDDLTRGAYAAYAVELADAFTADDDPNTLAEFNLLADMLGWLSEAPNLSLTTRYYELMLLGLAGYQPDLFACQVCGQEARPENQFFSVGAGGVVCAACAQTAPVLPPGTAPLSLNALKVLRHLQRQPFAAVRDLALSTDTLLEVERTLQRYLQHALERQLKSVAFLRLVAP